MKTSTKLIAVTGAGSGIGRALSLQLAAKGHRVMALDLDHEAAKQTSALDPTANIEAHKLDVADRDAFSALIDQIESMHGPIDVLVNNAGVGVGGEVRDHTYNDWHRTFAVNFFGTLHGVMAVYPRMIARRSGTIVNVASLAGLFPLPGEAAYVASKYAVVGLTRVLAIEADALGVKTMLVCPGKIETPIYDKSEVRGFDKAKTLAMWPKGITAEECAARIVLGLDRGERLVVITKLAQALWQFERQSPRWVDRFGGLYMRKMRAFRHE